MAARLLAKEETGAIEHAPSELSELRDRPCWLDVVDPKEGDLQLIAEELGLHPLAIEDALQHHERPKVENYETHYFIVFYAIEEPSPGIIETHQVSIFALQNAIVTVHTKEFAARTVVEKRFRDGKLPTTGLLLHGLLDTIVDGYFQVVDGFGERVELLEELVLEDPGQRGFETSLRELFVLKRDLLKIRHLVAPERDVLQVLIRGDIHELRERGRRVYYQDVYDHIVRVTDEIDTFRELTSNVIDAHLAAASNRLNQVMKVLTAASIILLVLSVVTSFFGMNFEILPFESGTLFVIAMGITVVIAFALLAFFRQRDYL